MSLCRLFANHHSLRTSSTGAPAVIYLFFLFFAHPCAVAAQAQTGPQNNPTVPVAAPATVPVAAPADKGSASPLVILPSPGTILYAETRAGYDMGKISLMSDTPVKHTFILKNSSSANVTITKLDETCLCIEVAVSAGASPVLPSVVLPGHTVSITMSLDPSLYQGSRRHSVSVYVKDQIQPAASLEFTGTTTKTITYSADALDFGTVNVGETRTLPLTVTLAPGFTRFIANVAFLVLRNSNPAIKTKCVSIQPPAPPIRIPADGGVFMESPREDNKPTVLKFKVTLASPATLGPLNTRVSLGDPHFPLDLVFQGTGIPVTGNVVGAVSAMPPSLTFMFVRAGEPASQEVLLMGKTAGDLDGLRVETDAPYLSATLSTAPDAAQSVTAAHLTVSVTSNPPPGVNHALVKVLLKNGQTLNIPVFLSVLPSPKSSVTPSPWLSR